MSVARRIALRAVRPALLLVPLACLAASSFIATACTPTRTTVAGPFELEGKVFETARELSAEITPRCPPDPSGAGPGPFVTDGCSMWPDGTWRTCCVAHDVEYWCGGVALNRRDADRALRRCVAERSGPTHAWFVYLGVRLGGHHLWPFGWRWGYGHDWPYRGRTSSASADDAPRAAVDVEAPVAEEAD